MALGCARIDLRLDTAKIGSAGHFEVRRARLLQLLGYEKRFHTAWERSGHWSSEAMIALLREVIDFG